MTTWTGWAWVDGDWRSVCSDPDMGTCHRQLITWLDAHGVPCKFSTLTGGQRPTWTLEGMA